jgi:hypothetical protein
MGAGISGSSRSSKARGVFCQISTPSPPLSGIKTPDESGFGASIGAVVTAVFSPDIIDGVVAVAAADVPAGVAADSVVDVAAGVVVVAGCKFGGNKDGGGVKAERGAAAPAAGLNWPGGSNGLLFVLLFVFAVPTVGAATVAGAATGGSATTEASAVASMGVSKAAGGFVRLGAESAPTVSAA